MNPNNKVFLKGVLMEDVHLGHTFMNQSFYYASVLCLRPVGGEDILSVLIPSAALGRQGDDALRLLKKGACVRLFGDYRSRPRKIQQSDENYLLPRFYIHVRSIELTEILNRSDYDNHIYLKGTLLSNPTLRRTPTGKAIADIYLSCIRNNGIVDFVPCILWEKSAFSANSLLKKGDMCSVEGYVQSRPYVKYCDDGSSAAFVSYEISAYSFTVTDKKESKLSEECPENCS